MAKSNKKLMTEENPTPDEVEAARLAREERKRRSQAVDPEPTTPPVTDSPDNDITSIREANQDDPNGEHEVIIDNNTPVEEEENGNSSVGESELFA